jgi:hypothetical protein
VDDNSSGQRSSREDILVQKGSSSQYFNEILLSRVIEEVSRQAFYSSHFVNMANHDRPVYISSSPTTESEVTDPGARNEMSNLP